MRTQTVYEQVIDRIEADAGLDAIADRVSGVGDRLGEGALAGALRGDWMGHALHPLLTDLPIGCWTSAAVLDVVGGRAARPAAQRLIGLGLLCVPATALTGLADYRTVPDRSTARVGVVHAIGNTAAALAYLASWRSRRRGCHLRGVVLALVGGGIASFTGYLGGHMAFARNAGAGARGTMPASFERGQQADLSGSVDGLLEVDEVAELLTIPVDRVHAMVAEGLLTPVGGSDAIRFAIAEVLATRQTRT